MFVLLGSNCSILTCAHFDQQKSDHLSRWALFVQTFDTGVHLSCDWPQKAGRFPLHTFCVLSRRDRQLNLFWQCLSFNRTTNLSDLFLDSLKDLLWVHSTLRVEHFANKCYSTVTCQVLLNPPQPKLGQLCASRCSKLTRRANRRRACLVLLCEMLTP